MTPNGDRRPVDCGDTHKKRQALMAMLASATLNELQEGLARIVNTPAFTDLRKPEIGLVMIQARTGGDGAAFNLGEATVTRASIRLETGETGFSCLLGREPDKARLAALADALQQKPETAEAIQREIADPVLARIEQEKSEKTAETAATKVNFFTLVRGDD